jgi:hypothetical protein
MSNEQRGMALFQTQPEGPGPFFRLTALSVVRLGALNFSPSALSAEKWATGSNASDSVNRP